MLEAQGDSKSALAQWKRTVARNPNALDAMEKIGNVQARRGDLRRAAVAYETTARLAPSTASALRAAAALDHAGDVSRAAYWRAVAAGIAKAPAQRQPAIHVELATTYRQRGMRDEAERELEQALQKSPRDPQLHRGLAAVYFQRWTLGGRLERAIQAWETAIALDPSDETDWQQLGQAYEAAGQTAKAVQCLEHAVDLEPGHGPAYLELGRAYARLGDKVGGKQMLDLYAKFVAYDQERQTLRTRARRKKASAEDLTAYGDLLRKTGHIDEATAQYERALSLRPKDSRLKARLNSLYARLGRADLQARLTLSDTER